MPKLASKLGVRGFTLIELMVTIAIIAILAVVAFSTYTGIQKSARDAKRKQDISAIANALEGNKIPNSANYSALTANQFGANAIPTEGITTRKYCAYSPTPIADPLSADWANTADCPSWTKVESYDFSSVNSWKICTWLEGEDKAYCRSNQQS